MTELKSVGLMALTLLMALLMVGIAKYGNTVAELVRNKSYRSTFVSMLRSETGRRSLAASLHSLGYDANVRPSRETRRAMGGGRLASFWMLVQAETGALTLVESAKLSTDDLQRGIVETFVLESAVLDRIPLINIEGNAFKYNEEATLPGVEFRAVNAAYTESTGTVNPKTESLVILGGDADVDRFIERVRSNLTSQRATQDYLKVKAAVTKYQDAFVNGDTAVDANSFDGLKKRLTGTQVVDAGTNGRSILGASESDMHAFLDVLDEMIDSVDGEVEALYMRKAIRQKLGSAARRLGFYEQNRDEFGRRVRLYNGIPMLDIGKKADGTEIIPQTETQGTSTVATSIYAVAFSEDESIPGVGGLTNADDEEQPIEVEDLGLIDAKPVFRTRIEFYCGLAVFGKGAARLRGVLNS